MSPNKKVNKANEKYVRALRKFGLLPDFQFTKKERKIVKFLGKEGMKDILEIADHFDWKPEKVRKYVDRLIEKGGVVVEGTSVALTPAALEFFNNIKQEKKATKKFYQFMDTLNEKEMDEFMRLVDSFKVVPPENPLMEMPEEPKVEEPAKPAPRARKPKAAEPKPEEAKAGEPAPKAKKAPAPRKPAIRKRAPRTAKPKTVELKPEEPAPEEPKPETPNE